MSMQHASYLPVSEFHRREHVWTTRGCGDASEFADDMGDAVLKGVETTCGHMCLREERSQN